MDTPKYKDSVRTEFRIGGQLSRLFAEMGYSTTTLRKIRDSLGINLAEELRNRQYRSEQVKTIMADCIIHGRVDSVVPFEAPPFYSIAWVNVGKWFRNDHQISGPVPVLLKNGMTDDGFNVITSHTETLEKVEEVYLFLSAPALYMDLERNNPKTLAKLQSSPLLYFQLSGEIGGVYRVDGDSLVSHDGKISQADWVKATTTTLQVIH